MRYNPATDRALYSIDEIAEQCRAAVLRSKQREQDAYAEILEFTRWEDDLLIPA